MPSQCLTPYGGEFRSPEREAAFQDERLSETLRHMRLLFLFSAALNSLFLLNDWRFYGELYSYLAVSARIMVVLVALLCFLALGRASTFHQAQRVMIAWEWLNAMAIAALVSSHSELALFAVLILPSIYYLAVPTSFRWTIASGVGCSVLMLAGYILPAGYTADNLWLILMVIMLNLALFLVVSRSNHLQRMQWAATQAERRAKNELIDSRAMFETMFKTVPIPLLVVRMDGSLVEMNDAALRYLGATPQSLGIETTHEFYVNPGDRTAFLARIEKDGQVSDFETKIRLADGSIRTVLLAGMGLEIGGTKHLIASVVDITERKAAEERIWRAASHDPLTGLPNRAFFQGCLEQMLAQAERHGSGVSLLLIDLDHLKDVNETLGHTAGDTVLKEAAERLSLIVAGEGRDCIARLGGDEFVAVVQTARPEGAQTLAEKFLSDLARPFAYGDRLLTCQASIGVASYPHDDKQPSDLMKDADLALQAAKALGRNRMQVYSRDMREKLEEKANFTHDIQEALGNGQIVPFYQPKVDLRTGKVIGFEALARWHHPVRGLLTPSSFLSVLDDPEIAIAFGESIVRQVVRDIRGWLDQGIDCGRVAINLSTAQFNWVGLAKRFFDIVHAAGVPHERLEVEITETVFLGRNTPHVAMALKQFRERGVRIALDDFGTGYASLVHLRQFPIDEIKIDQSFIRDLERDADSIAIVVALIELGKNLGMAVVAEGIETAGQEAILRENGCTHGQGHLYAAPMPEERVQPYLEQQARRNSESSRGDTS